MLAIEYSVKALTTTIIILHLVFTARDFRLIFTTTQLDAKSTWKKKAAAF